MENGSQSEMTGANSSARRRALSPAEAFWVLGSRNFVGFAMLMSGELDLAALDEAFVELQRQHEILQAVVQQFGSVLEFVVNPRPPAGIRIFEDEDPSLQATGCSAVFDQAEQLAHLDVVLGEECIRVTWMLHHAIADGAHLLTLFVKLWDLYTHRVETGSFPPSPAQPFAQSGEYYFNRRQYPGARPKVEVAVIPDGFTLPRYSLTSRECRMHDQIWLSEGDTAALARVGRAEGSSRNALVSAALIRAHTRAGAPVPLCAYAVNLRELVTPPVGNTEASLMFGAAYFDDAEIDPSPFALARKINDRIVNDCANGTVHQNLLTALPKVSSGTSRGLLYVSNVGRMPVPQLPNGLAVIGIQSVSLSTPEVPASEISSSREVAGYNVLVFNKQLTVVVTSKGRPGRNAELLAYIEEELRATINSRA